jgi:bacillithiol biosynthesis deacetylase BshB1
VGIIDLTRGEMGSRGTKEMRDYESGKAAQVMGLSLRENLNFRDCYFINDELHRLKIIEKIRQYRPSIVLANSPSDRHPDHARASKLVREACYYSGLTKIETFHDGALQEIWRPQTVALYIQDYFLHPSFVIDVSDFWQQKIEVLKCYSSQFYNPESTEPETPISGKEFFDFLQGKSLNMGRPCGFHLGEGFIVDRYIGIDSLSNLR